MNVRRMPMSNLNDIFFTPAANQELTYDQVLEDVQRYFAENHASTIAEAGEGNAERATSLLKELMEHYIVKRKYIFDCSILPYPAELQIYIRSPEQYEYNLLSAYPESVFCGSDQ